MLSSANDLWWQEIDLDQIRSWLEYNAEQIPAIHARMADGVARVNRGDWPHASPEQRKEWIEGYARRATTDIASHQAKIDRSRKCMADASERPWFVADKLYKDDGPRLCDIVESTYRLRLSPSEYTQLLARSAREPVLVDRSGTGSAESRRRWYFGGHFYYAAGDLESNDVAALVAEKTNRRRLTLEKAHAAAAMATTIGNSNRRQPIPREVRLFVWQRDGGRCVECTAQENLHFDHIIPVSLGGSNTERNLQLLCEPCNLRKGASLG